MVFSFLKARRRRRVLAEPFPADRLDTLRRNVFLYRLLPGPEQATLRDAVQVFAAEKHWEGCAGLAITDEVKVTIAGQACLLVLGFGGYYFDEVRSVLVYPGGYLAEGPADERVAHLSGEAAPDGPVILSWWDSLWFGRRRGPQNLVVHEFAHKLAERGDPEEGMPPIEDPALRARWKAVVDAEYDRPALLDLYGASDRAEFFAVATEAFFVEGARLRRRHPDLYEVLAAFYRQDPAGWRAPDADDAAEAEATEHEYNRHIIAECTAALRLRPDFVDAYQTRASFYADEGEAERALEDYGAVIRLSAAEAQVEAYCERGACYRDQGRYDEALADFDEALRRRPDYAWAYTLRGATHALQGDLDRALADLNQAVRLDPRDDTSYLERGRVYADQEQFDKAVRDFSKAIRLSPHAAEVYAERASAYLGRGEYDRAIADCEESLALEPRLPEAYRHRGVAYYHQGEYDKAVADCTEATRLDPEYEEAYRARALAYAAQGEEAKARADEARADELGSEAPET